MTEIIIEMSALLLMYLNNNNELELVDFACPGRSTSLSPWIHPICSFHGVIIISTLVKRLVVLRNGPWNDNII